LVLLVLVGIVIFILSEPDPDVLRPDGARP